MLVELTIEQIKDIKKLVHEKIISKQSTPYTKWNVLSNSLEEILPENVEGLDE